MENVKKRFWKCIDFIYKHKVISFFVAFGIATSFLLFNVFANDDQYANQLVVNNATITSIEDGTAEFDAEAGDGKDVSATNGILRNFDTITYNASFTLESKQGTSTDPITDRSVIVDVIVPKTVDAKLWPSNQSGTGQINPLSLNGSYNYYEFTMDSVSVSTNNEPTTFSFQLDDVNTQTPNTSFTPIVLIKESTDENFKAISSMNEEEMHSLISHLPNNKLVCDTNTIQCTTTITGRYDFDIALYQGAYNNAPERDPSHKQFPIGIGVTVPSTLGIYIPTSVSFTIGATFDNTLLHVSSDSATFVNYKESNANYTILYNTTDELNNINNTVSYENGIVTISNLQYNPNVPFIGTAAFRLKSERLSETSEADTNITLTANNLTINGTQIKATSGTLNVIDFYQQFVGKYFSKININPEENNSGETFMNYNQSFVIQESISYAADGEGDELSELDTYIKIDPTAFKIIKDDEINGMTGAFTLLKYGHGQWNGDYFELTGATGCPTDITTLTTEELMNLYGGPCLREKTTLQWLLKDEESELPVIIVNGIVGDKTSTDLNVNEALSETITLKAKVNNDMNLMNTSHQITSSATGVFNNTVYYLSNRNNYSDAVNASNKDNYKKSVYNFETRSLASNEVIVCANSEFCHFTGKTIHIIGFTVNRPEVHAYFNDVERNAFYDYPIEWRIDSNVSSNDDSIEYKSATISVIIPNTLNYLYAEIMKDGKRVQKNVSTPITDAPDLGLDIGPAKVYTYTFDEDEIVGGAIDTLSIFTDIYLNTKNETRVKLYVTADFTGYKANGTGFISIVDPRPASYKSTLIGAGTGEDDPIILYNGGSIVTYGNAAPRFVEKGQSYTYTMKSYNNSSDGANTGYSYANPVLYYMLPYIEDSSYKVFEKKFTNTRYKIKLTEVLPGYKVYYTTEEANNVISDVYNTVNPDTVTTWKEWTDPTTEIEATAIKIVKNDNWDIDTYFYSENGVNVIVTPVNNAQADAYYNGFLMTVNRPEGFMPECDSEQEECSDVTFSEKLYYQSSKSLVEVYSRQISGFVFEDYNYSDMYENGEDQLANIVVELYRLKDSGYAETSDPNNPNLFVNPSRDELISTTTTDSYGAYSFTGLNPGYYYVLFRYSGDKYTPCERFGGVLTGVSNADQINSKAIARNNVDNEAVSSIITLSSSESSNSRYINLGLRIRKEFGVEINKYITKIVQTSNQGTKTYEYDKATKVNIDIKNLKNTKFRVTYSFDIVNTKFFPGYIGVVADLIPNGMTFDSTLPENADWALYDGILYYTGIQNKLLLPGDKQYFSLVLDLDTSVGGTYLNIVAAQQPALMGTDNIEYDFSDITVEVNGNEVQNNQTNTGDTTNQNQGIGGPVSYDPDEGNGE